MDDISLAGRQALIDKCRQTIPDQIALDILSVQPMDEGVKAFYNLYSACKEVEEKYYREITKPLEKMGYKQIVWYNKFMAAPGWWHAPEIKYTGWKIKSYDAAMPYGLF